MPTKKELTDYIESLKTSLNEDYINVQTQISTKDVVFTSGESNFELCKIKLSTIKDSLVLGEIPKQIKKLLY